MEVSVEHLGDVQFEIKARRHAIVCDQPEELGGCDEGMTPPELLLSSLGSCAAYYAVAYLKKKRIATAGTRVRVHADKIPNPMRIDNFRISVIAPIKLTEEHRAGLEQAVHRCLIHHTLQHPPSISFTIQEEGPAVAA
jgi:uncharacterized OsmC-like protein